MPDQFDAYQNYNFGVGSPSVYSNSFELESDLDGWTIWHNCNRGADWGVWRYDASGEVPIEDFGQHVLRLHTSSFTCGGSGFFPGAFALSPPIPASYPSTYYVDDYSRNTQGNVGYTSLVFYDSAGHEIESTERQWQSGAWQLNPDPVFSAAAPFGTVSLRVRYGLTSPGQFADIDLVNVRTW